MNILWLLLSNIGPIITLIQSLEKVAKENEKKKAMCDKLKVVTAAVSEQDKHKLDELWYSEPGPG